jgi:hypothetical protein
MSALPPPDPLAFALGALEARGALSDQDDQGPYLLLPDPEARALQVPAELRLGDRPDVPGTVFCGFGSALLDQLCQGLRGEPLQTSLRLEAPLPRPAQATSLAERLVFRNAVHEVLGAGPLTATYATLVVTFVAEADDRHEGLVIRTVCASDGATPDPALRSLLDPTTWAPDTLLDPGPLQDHAALPWLLADAERQIQRGSLPPILDALGRRKLRDHERIEAYFAELIAEARAPRRKTDPEAIARKVEHLLIERDTKLRDLDTRYAARVRLQLAALISVTVPALVVDVRVRRRKESRELRVRLSARASALDAFRCEGCGDPTAHPAVCDIRLHLLCESCVPAAQGRFDCPACRRPRGA